MVEGAEVGLGSGVLLGLGLSLGLGLGFGGVFLKNIHYECFKF